MILCVFIFFFSPTTPTHPPPPPPLFFFFGLVDEISFFPILVENIAASSDGLIPYLGISPLPPLEHQLPNISDSQHPPPQKPPDHQSSRSDLPLCHGATTSFFWGIVLGITFPPFLTPLDFSFMSPLSSSHDLVPTV